jgi:hypothetical protein
LELLHDLASVINWVAADHPARRDYRVHFRVNRVKDFDPSAWSRFGNLPYFGRDDRHRQRAITGIGHVVVSDPTLVIYPVTADHRVR